MVHTIQFDDVMLIEVESNALLTHCMVYTVCYKYVAEVYPQLR